MKITPELAAKYAQYRDRFLGGTMGTYAGFTGPDPCGGNAGRRYDRDRYAPFMITSGDAAVDQGTFLHVDRFVVGNSVAAAEMEQSQILEVHCGDNTLYASCALVSFVAEYSITLQAQPLEIALGIARSFQRLSSVQRGWQETGNAPFGFVLRHDSRDTADIEENFCNFGGGTGTAAYKVAPSFDQYAGILSHIRFAKVILAQTPPDPANASLRNALVAVIDPLVERIVRFIAFKTNYTIRWDAGGVRQTADDRGPYCHFAAYPFARIASLAKYGTTDCYTEFLGEVVLDTFADLAIVLTDQVAHVLADTVAPFIREKFVTFFKGTITSAVWEAIAGVFDIAGKALDLFHDYVEQPLKQFVLDPLITQIQAWTGRPATGPISDVLAQEFFNVFVTGVLLDTSDKPLFDDAVLRLPVSKILEWMGAFAFPNSIEVNIPAFDIAPPAPRWWDETIMGTWPAPSWHIDPIPAFDIPIADLGTLEIPIPLSGLFHKLVALAKPNTYLKLHAYNLLAGADLFGTVPNTDARALAVKYDNAWFMAVAHRFQNVPDSAPGVRSTLNILVSAPDTFPKGKGAGAWNQDFRWIRDADPDETPKLFSGLDFMAPLMLASSVPEDVPANRDILIQALSPKTPEISAMGPFTLPFQGPISDRQVFELHAGGSQSQTILYISVVFDRPSGHDSVTLTVPTLAGQTEDVTFDQSEGLSKLIAAPLTNFGVKIKSASATAKGYISIATDA